MERALQRLLSLEDDDPRGDRVHRPSVPVRVSSLSFLLKGDMYGVRGLNFGLADLIGLDTTRAVAQSLYEEFKEPRYTPSPLLSRMVEAGLLGRKTGQGFYGYR